MTMEEARAAGLVKPNDHKLHDHKPHDHKPHDHGK
jgi:hypothetical protein